jgi:hypothetical protein
VAYLCWAPKVIDGEGGIYRAASVGKARYQCWRGAREAGFRLGFGDIRVKRAPEFDGLSFRSGTMPQYINRI